VGRRTTTTATATTTTTTIATDTRTEHWIRHGRCQHSCPY